jgi:hypothetical protein
MKEYVEFTPVKCKVENELYNGFKDVRNVIDFINSHLVCDYSIVKESYMINEIEFINLKCYFTTVHLEFKLKNYSFTISTLYPNQANSIKESLEKYFN